MKSILPATLVLLCPICPGNPVERTEQAVLATPAETRWSFCGTARKDEVVIFRHTRVRDWNGKVTTKVHDTVRYSPGKQETESAFFENADQAPTGEPRWTFKGFGSTGSIEGRLTSRWSTGEKAEIAFESSQWGKTRKTFEVMILPYVDAVPQYDGLPAMEPDGWEWAGCPKAPESRTSPPPTEKPER